MGSTPCAVVNHPELAHHLAMRTTERFGGSAAHEMLMLPQPACSIIDQGVLIAKYVARCPCLHNIPTSQASCWQH